MSMSINNSYVIYYGWLIAGQSGGPNRAAKIIASSKPLILVAAYYTLEPRWANLSPQVRRLLHAAGVQICAYIPTGYGLRDLGHAQAEATDYLANGADGIFYDEVDAFNDDGKHEYYRALSTLVRERGKIVIMNTGVADTGEPIMNLTDILMLEHQWRAFYQTSPWRAKYPAERFMGVSSNEPWAIGCLGHAIDEAIALSDTIEARQHGIGWHYSTDRYTELPSWYLAYAQAANQG
jgi:hypothetical protein